MDWHVWLLISLVLALFGSWHGTYRYVTKLHSEISDLRLIIDTKRNRKRIADVLAGLCLEGESLRAIIIHPDFDGDALYLYNNWGNKIKDYFYANPNELGEARLLWILPLINELIIPVPVEWYLNDAEEYAYIMFALQTDKLKTLTVEFLK